MLVQGINDPLRTRGGSRSHRSLVVPSATSRHYDNTWEGAVSLLY
jgi:hypothetical protein